MTSLQSPCYNFSLRMRPNRHDNHHRQSLHQQKNNSKLCSRNQRELGIGYKQNTHVTIITSAQPVIISHQYYHCYHHGNNHRPKQSTDYRCKVNDFGTLKIQVTVRYQQQFQVDNHFCFLCPRGVAVFSEVFRTLLIYSTLVSVKGDRDTCYVNLSSGNNVDAKEFI